MYGVGAGGAAGIRTTIDILRDELSRAAAHLGVRTLTDLSADYLRQPIA